MGLQKLILFFLILSGTIAEANSSVVTGVAAGYSQTCYWNESKIHCVGQKSGDRLFKAKDIQVKQVVSGEGFSCLLNAQSQVLCKGNISEPPLLNQPRFLSAGRRHVCALVAEGVKCWGEIAPPRSDLSHTRAIVSGDQLACALDDKGVKCWGKNTLNDKLTLKNPRAIALQSSYLEVCALHDEGVSCWNQRGENQKIPVALNQPTEIVGGKDFFCAQDADGIKCWGIVSKEQLRNPPKDLKNPRMLSAGYEHICVLDDSGPRCWGAENEFSILDFPRAPQNPRRLALGSSTTCALDDLGILCWGSRVQGLSQMPTDWIQPSLISMGMSYKGPICAMDMQNRVRCWPDNHKPYSVARVPALVKPYAIANDESGACVLQEDPLRPVRCWGTSLALQMPMNLKRSRAISAGSNSACVIQIDGQVVCWGDFERSEELLAEVPERIVDAQVISLHDRHACVLDREGVKCWGRSSYEELPKTPDDLVNPLTVGVGEFHACVIEQKEKNEVRCWGTNRDQQLEVPLGLKNPRELAVGDSHSCVITDDGVKCWGRNDSGQNDVPEDF